MNHTAVKKLKAKWKTKNAVHSFDSYQFWRVIYKILFVDGVTFVGTGYNIHLKQTLLYTPEVSDAKVLLYLNEVAQTLQVQMNNSYQDFCLRRLPERVFILR